MMPHHCLLFIKIFTSKSTIPCSCCYRKCQNTIDFSLSDSSFKMPVCLLYLDVKIKPLHIMA